MSNTQDELDFDLTDDVTENPQYDADMAKLAEAPLGTVVTEGPASEDNEGQADPEQAEQAGQAETQAPEKSDEEKAADAERAKADAAAAAAKEDAEREEALAAFKATVESVFESDDYDKATGVLPVALTQTVVDAYAKVPGAKGKSAAKAWLQESMQANMIKGTTDGPEWFMRARTFMELNNKVTAAKSAGTAAAKPKVDPTEAHVERVAAMLLAPNFVEVSDEVAEGWEAKAEELVASLNEDATKYLTWLRTPVKEGEEKPDAPEVSPVILAAAKIALGRSTAGRKPSSGGTSTPKVSTAGSGHRGDIGKHIREVMDTVEVGAFVTIAEIAKAETSQYGGATMPPPSQGAIAARLFPAKGDCTLDFVRPEGKPEGHNVKGAVRTA